MFRAGNNLVQAAHHLATVAHAQCKGVFAIKESGKLVAGTRVEQDGFCPALARAQHVAVGEAAAGRHALEISQADAPGDNIAHVHVDGIETGTVKRRGHLDLAVDALLAQDRHSGARS